MNHHLPQRILFVCIHNSARSQMAEAFLDKYGAGDFDAESAGIEPGILNPTVVLVMREKGLDLSSNTTQAVSDLVLKGKSYKAVITVCDQASAEKCPVFPGNPKRINWSFNDPSSFIGTNEEVLQHTRKVRDEIEISLRVFIKESGVAGFWI